MAAGHTDPIDEQTAERIAAAGAGGHPAPIARDLAKPGDGGAVLNAGRDRTGAAIPRRPMIYTLPPRAAFRRQAAGATQPNKNDLRVPRTCP